MKLTTTQCQFFTAFGYLVIPRMFSPSEIATIDQDFETSFQRYGGHHDGSKHSVLGGPLEHLPRMCAILDDPRILSLAGGLLGEDFNYSGGDGNYYTGDTGWHPDGSWGQLWSAKIAFYLDPITRDTGCLRVIPGSHEPSHPVRMRGIDPNKSQELYGVHPRDFPGNVPLETTPGDIVIFNHDTWHASYGGGQRRRMFTMNLTRRARTPMDFVHLRSYVGVHSAGGYKLDIGGTYFTPMLETANAQRMSHMEQIIAIHDELFPQYARRRTHAEQISSMAAVLGGKA